MNHNVKNTKLYDRRESDIGQSNPIKNKTQNIEKTGNFNRPKEMVENKSLYKLKSDAIQSNRIKK